MHEHHLTDPIIDAIKRQMARHGARKVKKATFQVSELAALSPEALEQMLHHAAEEAGLEPFEVEIRRDGLLGHCPSCGLSQIDDELRCLKCGRGPVQPAGDEAILLVSLELEQ